MTGCGMQGGAPVSACPATTNCSMSASIAIAPEDGVDAAEYALAMLNVTSTGILQVCPFDCLALWRPHSMRALCAASSTHLILLQVAWRASMRPWPCCRACPRGRPALAAGGLQQTAVPPTVWGGFLLRPQRARCTPEGAEACAVSAASPAACHWEADPVPAQGHQRHRRGGPHLCAPATHAGTAATPPDGQADHGHLPHLQVRAARGTWLCERRGRAPGLALHAHACTAERPGPQSMQRLSPGRRHPHSLARAGLADSPPAAGCSTRPSWPASRPPWPRCWRPMAWCPRTSPSAAPWQ